MTSVQVRWSLARTRTDRPVKINLGVEKVLKNLGFSHLPRYDRLRVPKAEIACMYEVENNNECVVTKA